MVRYLDFNSHHPAIHKAAVVKSLFSRDFLLSSSTLHTQKEIAYLHGALKGNNYPAKFIREMSQFRQPTHHFIDQQDKDKKSVIISYVRGLSEALKHEVRH